MSCLAVRRKLVSTRGTDPVLEEAAIYAIGLRPGEFKRGDAPRRIVDDELNEALKGTFPASDPISFESTLVSGSPRGNRR